MMTVQPSASLVAPRLQLRWELSKLKKRFGNDPEWLCHYELVLPLDKGDIRRKKKGKTAGGELTIKISGPTIRGSTVPPCYDRHNNRHYFDDPFREGCHAQWDSGHLGNLPIFVIDHEGRAFKKPSSPEGSTALSQGA